MDFLDAPVLLLAAAGSWALGYFESNDTPAIGPMIARLTSLEVPGSPKTTYNVGRIRRRDGGERNRRGSLGSGSAPGGTRGTGPA